MQFFEDHFTKHHFVHHPHQWFLAFLISPIHFLEMHYKTRYHLRFAHARKLFIFDISLLASIFFLAGLTLSYVFYHASIASLVYLNIQAPGNRILSGEHVEYTINYRNESDLKLLKSNLKLTLPKGLVLDKNDLLKTDNSIDLNTVKPGQAGEIKISGWFYNTPNQEENLTATLTFIQEKKQIKEIKASRLISILRGSVLQAKLTANNKITALGESQLIFTLQNTGKQTLKEITLPLTPNFPQAKVMEPQSQTGVIKDSVWQLSELAPGQTAQLTAKLKTKINDVIPEIKLNFTPSLKANNEIIPQATIEHVWQVLYPHLELSTNWENDLISLQPGTVGKLNLHLKNVGDLALVNGQLIIPLSPFIIDSTKAKQLNLGDLVDNNLILTARQFPTLAKIDSGADFNLEIKIPIVYLPQNGTDIILSLTPTLKAEVVGTEKNYLILNTNASPIKIGTQISLQGEARYYTAEGDQLGRGPLPPQVGKETKYWVLITALNNTSEADKIQFSATLPPYVKWTGKTSLTRGPAITYSEKTHQVYWKLDYLAPYEKIGLYLELALTPLAEQAGTEPIILEDISLTAEDGFTGAKIEKNILGVDISLANDGIGKEQGVKVR
jgi:uncharacterized cupredoxin-like copper-binding protein